MRLPIIGFITTFSFLLVCTGAAAAESARRPNILWITAEDLSPNLGCYGDTYARTPHLDRFAHESVRYTHAFATAPVCSPARSCLITGMYATSLGTQRLRSTFPVPAWVRGFPALLRDAGYYTCNNVKTDYNLRGEAQFIRDCWNESSPRAHWRKRKAGQPFFAVFNLMTTHQTRVSVWPEAEFEKEVGAKLGSGERHDPALAPLPPYYPDTTAARRAWARYHDCITAMDKQVGELMSQLEADGLAGETIVFFFGDNGMGMPRGKRCLWDTGLWEPMLVRFPEAWRQFAPTQPGGTTDRLVSFVDFAPTTLELCGVTAPRSMQGKTFLGNPATNRRQYAFGARDRVDEVFDLSRSVRDKRFIYIRNYMPHLSWMPPEAFSDQSAFRRELKQLAAEKKLRSGPLAYASPRKPLEELYDTDADPHQMQNLAGIPAHRATLEKMRQTLRNWIIESHDVGFLTEPQVWDRIGASGTPFGLAREGTYRLGRLLQAADLVGRPEGVPESLKLLQDRDDGVRYWATLAFRATDTNSPAILKALREALVDKSAVVRIEAAAALVERNDTAERALRILELELRSPQRDVPLHAARALELLGERVRPAWPTMRAVAEKARQEEETVGDPAMYLRFSLDAALNRR